MWRLAWSQLRFRSVRLVALLAGMLLATTAFTVLTAASRTAYDILVRPKGARTALESQTEARRCSPAVRPGIMRSRAR